MKKLVNIKITDKLLENYLENLVNQFFKILPMKEDGEPSLNEFMRSLQIELIGCGNLIARLSNDHMYLSLIAILQYLINNDCETPVVKR